MFAPSKIKVGARAVALALALATSSFSAHAVLERVGPVSAAPSVGGFPSWYQDTTGIALQFCDPKNAAEVAGGWCLLLGANVPTVPEVFPNNFFIEHFYFDATAVLVSRGGSRAKMIVAQEASFANGFNVIPGDQVAFSRIRVVLTPVPVTGTYRFIHPYGEEVLQGVAGGRIFFTDDVGLSCKGTFTCALNSRLGPFLLPSDVPGGLEMPALDALNPTPDTNPAHFAGGVLATTAYPGTGDAYIADPKRIGPVTGSPLPNFIDSTGASRNHNIFRIEGPVGSALGIDPVTGAVVDWVETTDMTLMGRLYQGAMPGQAIVNRASYTRNATGQKLDVLATGLPSTTARLPAAPPATRVPPALSFFDQPCAGTVDPVTGAILPPFSAPVGANQIQMLSTGDQFWGQTILPAVFPTSVCVENGNARDALGNLVPDFSMKVVTDEVTVTQAVYNPSVGTLSVAASSSDVTVPPTLTVAYGDKSAALVAGSVVVPSVFAPPSSVTVQSSALGSTNLQVTTLSSAAVAAPVATADSYTILEDSGQSIFRVLANDLNTLGGTVAISAAPALGVATVSTLVDPTQAVVLYTPNLNANGTDSFTYTVTVGGLSSSATATITIIPVNDPPVAVNDSLNAITGIALPMPLLANDTDVDGVTNPTMGLVTGAGFKAGVKIVTIPAGVTVKDATGLAVAAGGSVVGAAYPPNFLTTTANTYTLSYQAIDDFGALSANTATVTVRAVAPEAIVLSKAQFTLSKATLQVQGSITPAQASEVVTLVYLNAAGAPVGNIGTTTALNGQINVTFNNMPAPPVGATRIQATTAPSVNSATGSVATFALQIVN